LKRFQSLYIIPVLIATLAAILLTLQLLPNTNYFKIALIVLIPATIITIGFRWITYRRIHTIRNHLYQILQTLEEFDVDEPKKVAFETSPYPIFNELNEYLVELVDRIRNNYQANKQFTQNASHELQTPLAIIKGHIEILLQSPNIKEKEIESLAIVLQNTNRLSKINSALILLSKIEHQRFTDTTNVSFTKAIDEVLHNFKDLIQIQEIQVHKNYVADFEVEMSETLAEILVANLVQNAIRHNLPNGYIKLSIFPNEFTIENPGKPLQQSVGMAFKRFKRESEVEESLGLGLSIVKRICEQSDLDVFYEQSGEQHRLKVSRG